MNIPVWLTAVSFSLGETAYFGWNWTPASDAEVICDGISMLLLALAFVSGRAA